MIVRKKLFARGFRYRINNKKLPGSPDIVLPKYHALIFIHGCFWHGHDCFLFRLPSTNIEFWSNKIAINRQRDQQTIEKLRTDCWRIAIIWECALKGMREVVVDEVIENLIGWIKENSDFLEIRR
jgi:DNA mismatch endonuclease (patch repair protein)